MRPVNVRKLSMVIAIALVASEFYAGGAIANTAVADEQPQSAETDSAEATPQGGLTEIIVTAQRRSENLQKAALAVTAVDSQTLVRAAVNDTAQLTRVAPALQVSTVVGSANSFYLRGVGNFTTNSLSDAAVSFNIDGVPIARSLAAQAVFYDLERVEVLKGPQGTLYGRNSTGGAINVITAKPVAGEFSGFANAEYGNFDAVKLTGAVNIPMGDNGALRVAGLISDRDGYYSDGTGDDKTRAIRTQMASQLTDGFKLTVGADFAYQGGRSSGATVFGLDRSERIGIGDPRAGARYAATYVRLAGSFLAPLDNDSFNNNRFWGMYAQADIETPAGMLTLLPAYRYVDLEQRSYGGGFSYNERLKSQQTSVEARVSNDVGPISYIVGFYYLNEDNREAPAFNQYYFSAYGKFLSKTNSYAGFGRLVVKLSDALRLTGGARYTIDKKSASLDSYNPVVICPAGFAGGSCLNTPGLPNTFDPPAQLFGPGGAFIPVQPWGTSGAIVQNSRVTLSPRETFRKFTYRAGVEYDLSPSSLLYAAYETGFKSGGFFSSIDNPVYQPETIDAITFGSKNRFAGNRLQLNFEAFRWNYKAQQVSHFRLNRLGGTEFVTENVGATRIWGAEIETRAMVASNTTINATAQYLNAKYRNFVFANPATLGPPATGCANTLGGGVYTIDCSGRRPPNAPRWTFSGGIEQVVMLGQESRLILNVDGRYQSMIYTGFDQLPAQVQKGYAMFDAQVTYEAPGGGLTVTAFANNLTDKNVVGFSQPHPRSAALVVESLRPPRTYGLRLGYKF